MREAGVVVNDTPKIHVDDPTVEDHTLYFPRLDVRITLDLKGTFSTFSTSKPTVQEIDETDDYTQASDHNSGCDPVVPYQFNHGFS